MKNKLLVLTIIVFTIVACKKETPTVQVKVIDQVTNSPVAGARVIVYKCGAFNCYFGGIDLFSGVTDDNGICKVPETYYNEAVYARVEKENYWAFDDTKSTSKSIVPAGWMRLRIMRTVNYPDQSSLHIAVTSQSVNSSGAAFQVNVAVSTPADSSILIKGFGGQLNKIDWEVYGPNSKVNGGSSTQQVPRLDTIKGLVLNY